MIQADCDRLPNYQGWIKPPAIYDRCQPTYEDAQDLIIVDQVELDEWLNQAEENWAVEGDPQPATADIHAQIEKVIDIRTMFEEEAERWSRETEFLSSTPKLVLHDSYQRIMAMGPEVVPFLLQDLQKNRRSWFWALRHLTQANPVPVKDQGNLDKMIAAWVAWGKQEGRI
jgi:hypothetical protein